jgi:phage repressor protein C with HTH and peptisase S24 domain
MEESVKERLIKFKDYLGIGQAKFEQRAGLSNGYLNQLKNAPGANKLQSIIGAFPELNKNWLLTGEGSMLNNNADSSSAIFPDGSIPVYGIDATCGYDLRNYADMPLEGYVHLPSIKPGSIIIRAHGDSMSPTIKDGDYISIYPVSTWDYIIFGHIYIVELPDYRLVKRIRKAEDDEKIILRSDNPDYDDVLISKSEIVRLYVVQTSLSVKSLF